MRSRTKQSTAAQSALQGAVMQSLEQRTMMAMDNLGTVAADGNELAWDFQQRLHRVWRDPSTLRLWYAKRVSDTVWSEPIQVDSRSASGELAIAVDSQFQPSIAYRDFADGDLIVSTFNGSTFTRTIVDSAGDVGDHPSIKFSRSGKPYISYYDRTNGDLKLAWQNNAGNWLNTALETSGDVGAFNSLLVDGTTGLVRIAYTDSTGMRLKYAQQQVDGTWFIRSIDRGTPAGVRFSSITLDNNGMPWIAYYDVRKKDLRVATTADGVSWSSQRVASAGWQGEFANIFVNSAGNVSVLYSNRSLNTVNIASNKDNQWVYRFVAVAGSNLTATVSTAGQIAWSSVNTIDGKLRTSGKFVGHDYADEFDAGERIMHWETISGGNQPASVRTIGWGIPQHGWGQYVSGRFATLQSYGTRRILLHNPFGTLPGEAIFQFDQFILAQEAGLTNVTNTFVDAWRPVTQSGVEVIAYIGKLWQDPDFDALTDFDAYMDRVMRSIRPMIEAGVSIGFDSIVAAPGDSRAYMVVEAVRNSGVKVYNENRPSASNTFYHSYNGVYYDHWWPGGDPANNPDAWWAATNQQLTGEILRATMNPPTGLNFNSPGWRGPDIIRLMREGHTAVTQMDLLHAEGLNPNSLMATAFPASAPAGGTVGSGTTKFGNRGIGNPDKQDILS